MIRHGNMMAISTVVIRIHDKAPSATTLKKVASNLRIGTDVCVQKFELPFRLYRLNFATYANFSPVEKLAVSLTRLALLPALPQKINRVSFISSINKNILPHDIP